MKAKRRITVDRGGATVREGENMIYLTDADIRYLHKELERHEKGVWNTPMDLAFDDPRSPFYGQHKKHGGGFKR